MGEASPDNAVGRPTGAVFLSYASQDAEAAQRICDALRAAGVEVWFDQTELRGGEVWDQKIRQQIHDCALFVPVISQHTQQRLEGYFRLEWKLAVDRSHLMAAERPFLVPVVVDATRDQEAFVPEPFRAVQWTRLPAGVTPPAFIEHIRRLLSPQPSRPFGSSAHTPAGQARRWSLRSAALVALGAVAAISLAYLLLQRSAAPKPQGALPPQPGPVAAAAAGAFTPPAHSIAVLPFVNMSGDREQEYFSDGLTEELLNSLTRINELHVAARTSAFSFKGKDVDIDAIAHKLNVGAVLEGSVRRSTHTVRITAQLIDAVTGFHVWSQTYDRDLGDVLAVQTDIATAVANALKVKLLGDVSKRIELGGTGNPAALDAYLRGKKSAFTRGGETAAIDAYSEAIALDPHFAMAFAERSLEQNNYARFDARGAEVRVRFDKALADARTAVRLAPELAEAHYVLGVAFKSGFLEYSQANAEYERALALAPGSARILSAYSRHAAELGRAPEAIAAARRAVSLDPLNAGVHHTVGIAYGLIRQYADSIAALRTAISLQPDDVRDRVLLGEAQRGSGDFEAARVSCEVGLADEQGQACLAVVYWQLGRHADAEAMLRRLRSSAGDDRAYDFACIYAQWGDIPQALHWLEIAWRQRNSELNALRAEADLDPLRKEPRFQAIERALNFPD